MLPTTSTPSSISSSTTTTATTSEKLSGSMSNTNSDLSTLDEPVSTTIMRDVSLVGSKLWIVLNFPSKRNTTTTTTTSNASTSDEDSIDGDETLKALREWDLWGPLMVCLLLSIMLSITAPPNQSAMVFTGIFLVIWVGAAVVTVNAQLLGSPISFFQSICVLGYCVFPLCIATLLCLVLELMNLKMLFLRLTIVSIGYLWATRASVIFMTQLISPKRKALAIYPVFLFYIFLAWMILIQ